MVQTSFCVKEPFLHPLVAGTPGVECEASAVHVRRPGIDGWCQPLPAPLRSKPLGSDHHRFVRTGNRPRFCVVVTLKDLGLRICSGLMGATVHFSVSFILWYKSSVAHIK